MRRPTALAIIALIALVVACNTIPARQPLAQQPIGTGVPGGPSATPAMSAPTSASEPSPSATANPTANPTSEPAQATGSSSSPPGPPSTVADLCPPKGQKPDISRLAAKGGCKNQGKQRSRQLAELRSNEQLLASMQPNAPEREELVAKLAVGYAQLECSIAAACAKSRDANATPDEITVVEAKKKTDDFCSTLKSEFPKSKRQCP